MKTPIEQFQSECEREIEAQGSDKVLEKLSYDWAHQAAMHKYGYHFTWLGRPIIQYPTDIMAMQEIIWQVKPDVIIETGIAHGGSIIFYASMIELLKNNGVVIGIDIDIRKHNRVEIEKHPLCGNIRMIEASSIEEATVAEVRRMISEGGYRTVLVVLDSCHTHEHVLRELELYGELVTKGSYMVCMDTVVGYDAVSPQGDRPWNAERNPLSAVREYLKGPSGSRFSPDERIDNKLLISAAPTGYLRCIG